MMAEVDNLTIALIQSDIIWEKQTINFSHYEKLLEQIPKETHLVMLPETFCSGFMPSAEQISEQEDSIVRTWMQKQATHYHFCLCGTAMITEDGKLFNRFYFVCPDGVIETYDKRHLFGFGGENKLLSAGSERKIFSYLGWKFFPQICYDIRFPVWIRNRWNQNNGYEYDLILLCSNWPASRIEILNTLLPARAIENQCYVAGVNRIGYDGSNIFHNGCSRIVNYKGTVLSKANENEEVIIVATLSKTELLEFRNHYPFGQDQDRFIICD